MPSAQLLIMSVMNRPGVVLLKPCFSSRTNVEYTESGRDGIVDTKTRTPTKTIDWTIWDAVSNVLSNITGQY